MCPVSSWIQCPTGQRTKCFCTAFLHLGWTWPTALRTLCLKTSGFWLLVHGLIYCHPLLYPPSLVSQQTMILWKPRCGQGCLCLLQVRMNTAHRQVLQSVVSVKTQVVFQASGKALWVQTTPVRFYISAGEALDDLSNWHVIQILFSLMLLPSILTNGEKNPLLKFQCHL